MVAEEDEEGSLTEDGSQLNNKAKKNSIMNAEDGNGEEELNADDAEEIDSDMSEIDIINGQENVFQ